ncbi:MAG: RNA methyltransferase, partial [Actinomycetota bacterium]|nr:RNA methyltransferase [Actinomycetota bacterium]
MVVVGRRPALEAVRSGRAIEVLVADSARSTEGLREVAELAGSSDVPVHIVEEDRIESLAAGERHQGVAARVDLPVPLDERRLVSHDWSKEAIVVVLDGVTDPHNVGAVARSAEAAGAEALVIRRHRAAPIGPAAMRSSAGALIHLAVAEVPNLPRALNALKEQGFWVVGLDAGAETTVESERPSGRLALVLGSEGEGLSRLVARTC